MVHKFRGFKVNFEVKVFKGAVAWKISISAVKTVYDVFFMKINNKVSEKSKNLT